MLKIQSKMRYTSEETLWKALIQKSENKRSTICIEQETIEHIFNETGAYLKRKKS